jgi:hypothetical protein
LTTVTNHSTPPQSINSYVFSGVSIGSKTLRVPSSALSAYQGADVWKTFGTIIGF